MSSRGVRDPSGMPRNRLALTTSLIAALLSAFLVVGAFAGRRDPGPSAPLGPVTGHSGCHVHGALPDRACTPGARFTTVTTAMVCRHGYSRGVRHVTYEEKRAVYDAYGMHRHFNGDNGEVDHLVPLELGGSNDQSNLWPETAAGRYGSHQKDQLENDLHDEVCGGRLSLSRAQRLITGNWVKVYRSRFG
jgi:hypothetical protein